MLVPRCNALIDCRRHITSPGEIERSIVGSPRNLLCNNCLNKKKYIQYFVVLFILLFLLLTAICYDAVDCESSISG